MRSHITPPSSGRNHLPVRVLGAGQGVGGRSYYGRVPELHRRDGTFASSDKAEGPLSQLTISLSCEPPSAAGGGPPRRAVAKGARAGGAPTMKKGVFER